MTSELASVLSVLAHEIRTPLAVSQGYLRLMAEGRFTAAEEHDSAVERTRLALNKLAVLCEDMSRLGALADAELPSLGSRVPVSALIAVMVNHKSEGHAVVLRGAPLPVREVATDGTADLADAVGAFSQITFADAGPEARVVDIANISPRTLTVILGGEAAVADLPRDPDSSEAAALSLGRGGFGVSLFCAVHVLRRHRVRTWQHADRPGAIGMAFSLVDE